MGNSKQSNSYFEKVIDNYPKSISSKKTMLLLDIQEQLSRVNSSLKKHSLKALKEKAKELLDEGQIEQAVAIYTKILMEYPRDRYSAKACYYVGYYYLLQGRFELAKEVLAIHQKLYSSSPNAGDVKKLLVRINELALQN